MPSRSLQAKWREEHLYEMRPWDRPGALARTSIPRVKFVAQRPEIQVTFLLQPVTLTLLLQHSKEGAAKQKEIHYALGFCHRSISVSRYRTVADMMCIELLSHNFSERNSPYDYEQRRAIDKHLVISGCLKPLEWCRSCWRLSCGKSC